MPQKRRASRMRAGDDHSPLDYAGAQRENASGTGGRPVCGAGERLPPARRSEFELREEKH